MLANLINIGSKIIRIFQFQLFWTFSNPQWLHSYYNVFERDLASSKNHQVKDTSNAQLQTK